MKRLTTDHPKDNFETALNFVYSKDGAAHIRSDGERDDVPLHKWAKKQCVARGCDEFPGETLEEIDATICECGFDFPDCPVHLAYTFACQAVHLRDRLKMYEDIGLMPEEIKSFLRKWCDTAEGGGLTTPPNTPLTLEELREMDGGPVYITRINDSHIESGWALVHREWCGCKKASGCVAFFERYGEFWLAYCSATRFLRISDKINEKK